MNKVKIVRKYLEVYGNTIEVNRLWIIMVVLLIFKSMMKPVIGRTGNDSKKMLKYWYDKNI